VHVYPNQWLPIQSRDHSVWQTQHHWKLHCGRVHTMCMQPPAHIKHVALWFEQSQCKTYHLLVSLKISKYTTNKKKKLKQQAACTWDIPSKLRHTSCLYMGHPVEIKTHKLLVQGTSRRNQDTQAACMWDIPSKSRHTSCLCVGHPIEIKTHKLLVHGTSRRN
jgi:hypothetical protein